MYTYGYLIFIQDIRNILKNSVGVGVKGEV